MYPWLGFLSLLALPAAADLASIQQVLDTINAGLRALDTAVLGVNEQNQDTLTQLGAAAVPALNSAIQIIQQSGPLSEQDAASLSTATAALRQNSNLTINDFIAKKPFFDSTNTTGQVLMNMQADKAASVALAQALADKVPDTSQTPGAEDTSVTAAIGELSAIFDRGIAAFSTPGSAALAPGATGVDTGVGTLNTDGSCNCAVQCPAGSFL